MLSIRKGWFIICLSFAFILNFIPIILFLHSRLWHCLGFLLLHLNPGVSLCQRHNSYHAFLPPLSSASSSSSHCFCFTCFAFTLFKPDSIFRLHSFHFYFRKLWERKRHFHRSKWIHERVTLEYFLFVFKNEEKI